jgi:nucleosome binding factor SPN SPT16 subunit
MIVGSDMKTVMAHAKSFVASRDATLSAHLSKSLGFCLGLEFRDSGMVLTEKNNHKFEENMVFTLSVGFHAVPLSAEDKAGATSSVQKLDSFSLLLADTVLIQKDGSPEVLTKFTKEYGEVSYNIAGGEDEDEEEDDEDGEGKDADGLRRSKRSKEEKLAQENAANMRQQKQQTLMKKKIAEAQKRLEKMEAGEEEEEEAEECHDIEAYKSPADYPRDVQPNQIRVDLDRESLIVPINGQPVRILLSYCSSFFSCLMSLSLSLSYPSIAVCLHALTPHDTSLTILPPIPPSIINQ